MEIYQLKEEFKILSAKQKKLGGIFDLNSKKQQLAKLQKTSLEPDFWIDSNKASKLLRQNSALEKEIKSWELPNQSPISVIPFLKT